MKTKHYIIFIFIAIAFIIGTYGKDDECHKAGIIVIIDNNSIAFGVRGGFLAKKIDLIKSDKKMVRETLDSILVNIRQYIEKCVDNDTIYFSIDSSANSEIVNVAKKSAKKTGFKHIIESYEKNFERKQAFYKAAWRFPDSCYIDEKMIEKDATIKELVYQKRDTIKGEENYPDYLLHERIIMTDKKFNSWKWTFYVGDNYLGADGLMPDERMVGEVEMSGDTAILSGYIDRYGRREDFGKKKVRKLVKYKIDHNLQEFWLDIDKGRFFIRKNYFRK